MPIRISCEACRTPLKVSEQLAGRRVKCPTCGDPITVTVGSLPADTDDRPPRLRERGEGIPLRPDPDDRPRREAEGITTGPRRDEAGEARLEKPRRRRRRKRDVTPSIPAWVWWLGSTAVIVLGALSLVVAGALFGAVGNKVLFITIYLAVSIPVSAIILVVSMIISSGLGGGIEFGEVHVVIPKALGLLFVVNLIGLLPFGIFLAFPVWAIGLMVLFKLDLWETRVLITVNWGLNAVVRFGLMSVILAAG
jgi:hypothetical protein